MKFALLGILFLAPQDSALPPQTTAASKRIDGVVAIVNNEVITESMLQGRLDRAKKSFGFKEPAEWNRFVRDMLVQMVKDTLYAQAAKRSSLDQQRIDMELEELLKGDEKLAGGKAALIEKLQQMGQNYEEYKRDRRLEIESRNLQYYEMGFIPGSSGRFSTEIYVSPGEMRQYFKNHEKEFVVAEATRARQIFLTAEDDLGLDDAKAKAATLLERLNKGEDFAKLAEEASEWKAAEGGDMGWVPRENSPFDRRIVAFLFSNPAGKVSEPIVLPSGVALVKVEERREKKIRGFEECQVEVTLRILRERHEERRRGLIDKLLRDSYVWPEDLLRG